MAVCETKLLLVTVCVLDESVVTTAPNIKYLVWALLVNGLAGAVTVALLLSYLAELIPILRLVMLPDQ